MTSIPTHRLDVVDPADANAEILTFAAELEAKGERPRFEVRYPAPEGVDLDEYAAADEETFDAVEVVNGEIRTLPPYSELRKAEEAN